MSTGPEPGRFPPVRIVSGLLYAAAGTALALIVFVFVVRLIGSHGGAIGASAAATASNLTGLNA